MARVYQGRPTLSPAVAALAAAQVLRPGDRVLDLGCGDGLDAISLALAGFRVEGVDESLELIELARRRARAQGAEVRFHAARLSELRLPPRSFDAVIDTLLLNNLAGKEWRAYVRLVSAVLPPGGVLVIQTRVGGAYRYPVDLGVAPRALARRFAFGPPMYTALPERGGTVARVGIWVGRRRR